MTINFKTPEIKELQPRLLVMGVGGAGGNAINEMIENGTYRRINFWYNFHSFYGISLQYINSC